MKVLAIILVVLAALCVLPIGIRAVFDAEGFRIRAVLGLIQFQVFPGKEGEEEKADETPLVKRIKKSEQSGQPKPLGVKLQELLPKLRCGLKALGELRWLFTVQKLKIYVTYGGTDAGKIAMNYGRLWGIMGVASAMLNAAFRIKKYDVQPILDNTCKETRVTADACVTTTLGSILCYLIRCGWRGLKLRRATQQKGGATL